MSQSMSFEGQVAIVTGAGRGLGRSHALELARRGAKVVVNDLGGLRMKEGQLEGEGSSIEMANSVVEEIEQLGGEAVASCHTVATEEGANCIVDLAIERFGRIDVLVNNAGIGTNVLLNDESFQSFHQVMGVNIYGTMYMTKLVWPYMMRQNYGRVVQTSSPGALFGIAGTSTYTTSKAAIVGLTKSLGVETNMAKDLDIRVNCIAPGAATPGTSQLFDADNPKSLFRPEHVSAAVIYLASKQCKLNGEIIGAGGGRFARIAIADSEGVLFNPTEEITAEQVESSIDQIMDFSNPTVPVHAQERSEALMNKLLEIAPDEAKKLAEKFIALLEKRNAADRTK